MPAFVNNNVSYKINECCILIGKGQVREELKCDMSANNPDMNLLELVTKFIRLKNRFKIFSKQPINTFNYCGTIPENNAGDLYVSSKVNIALDKYSLYRILESGGTPLTNIKDCELPEEMVFDDTKGLAYHSGKVFTGKATQHYENGQLSSEVHYFEGQRHGLESSFFEDGAKKFEARFEANQLVGVFEEWYQNGQRKSQEVWQQGKRRSITEWDENGNLLSSD